MTDPRHRGVMACVACAVIGAGAAAPARAVESSLPDRIDFNRDIRPILSNRCYGCHGPDAGKREAGLQLDTHERATAAADSGGIAIVPGKPRESELLARVSATDADVVMPPPRAGDRLSSREIALLDRWIEQGAQYDIHWSYRLPTRPPLPDVSRPECIRNPIDRFVVARLEAEGLAPAAAAPPLVLARRASLAVIGLPPSLEAADAVAVGGDYEGFIDGLLADPGYGEHWARPWLDLARYADSTGYAEDNPRTIWPWRDWLVGALNSSLPFDRFTIEMLAGDLLPSPTRDQRIATGFHRNTLTNSEGGTDDEEYRSIAIADRVNTTYAVWMGTTMACAQCHSHKYDPITQEDYFRSYAILNNTADADRDDETPVVGAGTAVDVARREALESEQTAIRMVVGALNTVRAPGAKTPAAPPARLAAIQAALAALPTTPVMEELPPERRRTTHVQYRGNFLDRGPVVTAGLPAALAPAAAAASPDRLALARWLVSHDNPLTARVIVNRLWEKLSGIGIVATSEEFGSQGELPSHPELLDWLAVEFRESGWDVKHMVRLIVTSATWRQSSAVVPADAARDPDNRLLARGPRVRMPAETIRDATLAAAGLLSRTMGGPPVQPPQPASGLTAAFGGGTDWTTSTGEDRYRRGIYTRWRRSNPYPSMTTFDAPNREFCTIRRPRTNTPLQALVVLNDPVFLEAAQALGRRMVREGGSTTADRIGHGFRLCFTRLPTPVEADRLAAFHDTIRARYAADRQAALTLATNPLGPLPAGLDQVDMAAWTMTASVMLNLDEFVMCP
ncbi:MAG: PSD1 and planctomycete cytochrome C domain-containing protein [Planctomycetaceae bacterium]